MKVRKAYGIWCPICQTGEDKRKTTHVNKRREQRAWKREVWS